MRRLVLILAAAFAATVTAGCGGGDVAVQAQLERQTESGETEAVALGSLPVRLLPYDRDVLFDSLAQAYPEPEPVIPDTISDLQDRVVQQQLAWQQAETRWGVLRDSLQTLSERMNAMDQASGEYFAMFRDFNELESEVTELQTASEEAFRQFTQLQTRLNAQSREIMLARQNWSDEAFAPVDSIIEARLEEMGLEEHADTTSAQGVARFSGIPAGQWWVYARYDRQYDELYWNEPIEVVSGEELVVRLTEENAEVRQKL